MHNLIPQKRLELQRFVILYIGRKGFTNSVILGRGHPQKEEMARVGLGSDKTSLNLTWLNRRGGQRFFSLQPLRSPCVVLV